MSLGDHWCHEAIRQPILGSSAESYDKRVLMCGKSPDESTGIMIVTNQAGFEFNAELVKRGDILIIPPGQDVEFHVNAGLAAIDIHMANEAMDQILIYTGTEPGPSKLLRPSWHAWLDLCQSACYLSGVSEADAGGKQEETVEFSDAVVESLTRALDQT